MTLRDPFRIEGPAIISFSGGRTSAYMLWRILQSWGGTLPDDVKVCFANTGKEMPETLDFVRDCGERWRVEIVWLEHLRGRVTYQTASRQGEPFAALVAKRSYLPNPVARFCTQVLKIYTIRDYAKSLGWETWTSAVGIRADEPRRVAKLTRSSEDASDRIAPLATAGITKRDVGAFWAKQNFGLALPSINGTTPLGNCDLCFLKSAATITGIMRDRPELAQWWIDQEAAPRGKGTGATFRADRPSYAAMHDAVERQANMDFGDLDQRIDCMCSEDAA